MVEPRAGFLLRGASGISLSSRGSSGSAPFGKILERLQRLHRFPFSPAFHQANILRPLCK